MNFHSSGNNLTWAGGCFLPWALLWFSFGMVLAQEPGYDANIKKIGAIKLLKEQVRTLESMEVDPEVLVVEMLADCRRHKMKSASLGYYHREFLRARKQEKDNWVIVIFKDLGEKGRMFSRRWIEEQADQILAGSDKLAYDSKFKAAYAKARKKAVERQWKEPEYFPKPVDIEEIYRADPDEKAALIQKIKKKIMDRCIFSENEKRFTDSLIGIFDSGVSQLRHQLNLVTQSNGGVFRTESGMVAYIQKGITSYRGELRKEGTHVYDPFPLVEEKTTARARVLRKLKLEDFIRDSGGRDLLRSQEVRQRIGADTQQHKKLEDSLRLLASEFRGPFRNRLEAAYKKTVLDADGPEPNFDQWLQVYFNSKGGEGLLKARFEIILGKLARNSRLYLAHEQVRQYFPALENGTYPFCEDLLIRGAEGKITTVSMEESGLADDFSRYRKRLLDSTEDYLANRLEKHFTTGVQVLNDQVALASQTKLRTQMKEKISKDPNKSIHVLLADYCLLVEPEWRDRRAGYRSPLGNAYKDLLQHTKLSMRDFITQFLQEKREEIEKIQNQNAKGKSSDVDGTGKATGDGPHGGSRPSDRRSGVDPQASKIPCPPSITSLTAIITAIVCFLLGGLTHFLWSRRGK